MRAFTDNKYLWFTAIAANAIGRIDITTGAMKAFPNTANIGVPIEDTNDGKGNICKY
jgi:streptogramin lyase